MIIHKLIRSICSTGMIRIFTSSRPTMRSDGCAITGSTLGPGIDRSWTWVAGMDCSERELIEAGLRRHFRRREQYLLPPIASAPFRAINLDRDDPASLGAYDVVICSNVLEHLAKPFQFIASMPSLLLARRFLLPELHQLVVALGRT